MANDPVNPLERIVNQGNSAIRDTINSLLETGQSPEFLHDKHYDGADKFREYLSRALEGHRDLFDAVVDVGSQMINEYLSEEQLNPQRIGLMSELLLFDEFRVDISKLLAAIKKTPHGMVYRNESSQEGDLRLALLIILKGSQTSYSPQERQPLIELWKQEIGRKGKYADISFWSLVKLDESRTKEWYDLLKQTIQGPLLKENDWDLHYEGLDKKYGIKLVNAGKLE